MTKEEYLKVFHESVDKHYEFFKNHLNPEVTKRFYDDMVKEVNVYINGSIEKFTEETYAQPVEMCEYSAYVYARAGVSLYINKVSSQYIPDDIEQEFDVDAADAVGKLQSVMVAWIDNRTMTYMGNLISRVTTLEKELSELKKG